MKETNQDYEKSKYFLGSKSSSILPTRYLGQKVGKTLLEVKMHMLAFAFLIMGSSILMAQSTTDQALVLQKCLDLTQIQQYYPTYPNNSFKPLVVLQHAVSFPPEISVSHGGNPIALKNKAEVSGEAAYFLFWKFDILGNTAKVDFVYNYDLTTTVPRVQKVTLELQKTGSVWNITGSTILGGTL